MRSSLRLCLLSSLLCACGPLVSENASAGDAGTSGGLSEDGESSGGSSESSSGAPSEGPAVALAGLHVVPADNHDAARGVVGANHEALHGCYEAALDEDPSLRGRYSIEVAVEATGEAAAVSVSDRGLPESLRECWVTEVSGWTFPLDVPVATTVSISGVLTVE